MVFQDDIRQNNMDEERLAVLAGTNMKLCEGPDAIFSEKFCPYGMSTHPREVGYLFGGEPVRRGIERWSFVLTTYWSESTLSSI
jgi:hypothetical protein